MTNAPPIDTEPDTHRRPLRRTMLTAAATVTALRVAALAVTGTLTQPLAAAGAVVTVITVTGILAAVHVTTRPDQRYHTRIAWAAAITLAAWPAVSLLGSL